VLVVLHGRILIAETLFVRRISAVPRIRIASVLSRLQGF
jgi:hypothetical protein